VYGCASGEILHVPGKEQGQSIQDEIRKNSRPHLHDAAKRGIEGYLNAIRASKSDEPIRKVEREVKDNRGRACNTGRRSRPSSVLERKRGSGATHDSNEVRGKEARGRRERNFNGGNKRLAGVVNEKTARARTL